MTRTALNDNGDDDQTPREPTPTSDPWATPKSDPWATPKSDPWARQKSDPWADQGE